MCKYNRFNDTTTVIFAVAFIFWVLPAVAGMLLFMQTLILNQNFTICIDFNAFGEWWLEFVMCVGGFVIGLILWIVGLVRYSKGLK